MTDACPTCGQPMPIMRLGVHLTPLKARLFDCIRRAGQDGITSAQMIEVLGLDMTPATIKAHVWQINEALESAGWRIVGRQHEGYRLIRLRAAA